MPLNVNELNIWTDGWTDTSASEAEDGRKGGGSCFLEKRKPSEIEPPSDCVFILSHCPHIFPKV